MEKQSWGKNETCENTLSQPQRCLRVAKTKSPWLFLSLLAPSTRDGPKQTTKTLCFCSLKKPLWCPSLPKHKSPNCFFLIYLSFHLKATNDSFKNKSLFFSSPPLPNTVALPKRKPSFCSRKHSCQPNFKLPLLMLHSPTLLSSCCMAFIANLGEASRGQLASGRGLNSRYKWRGKTACKWG